MSRILFRTGESEYSINGVTCRLLDVQELLSDAGVGRQQHVIVSQGQIDAVLNARPEERRSIIEEAAGRPEVPTPQGAGRATSRRDRGQPAARAGPAARGSPPAAAAGAPGRRGAPAWRPRHRTERAADLPARAGDRIAAPAPCSAGRREDHARTRPSRSCAASSPRSTSTVMAAEAELTARGDLDLSDEMVRVEQFRERARGIAAVLVERRRSMERDRGQLMDSGVVASLEADANNLRRRARTSCRRAAANSAQKPSSWRPRRSEFGAEREQALLTIDNVGHRAVSAASAAAEVRGELRSLRGSAERAEGELQRLRTRLDVLSERIVRLDADSERLRVECEQAQRVEAGLVADLEAAEARRITAEAAYESAHLSPPSGSRRHVAMGCARRGAAPGAGERPGPRRRRAPGRRRGGARARCSTSSTSTPAGRRRSKPRSATRWRPSSSASPQAGRRALDSLHASNVHGAVIALGAATALVRRSARARCAGAAARAQPPGRVSPNCSTPSSASTVRVSTLADAIDLAIANPQAVVVTDDGDRFGADRVARRRGQRRGHGVGARGGAGTARQSPTAELEGRTRAEQAGSRRARRSASARGRAQPPARHPRRRLLGQLRRAGPHAEPSVAIPRPSWRRSSTPLAEADERLDRERSRIAELDALVPALEAGEAAEAEAARARGRSARRARRPGRAAGRSPSGPRSAQRRPARAPAVPRTSTARRPSAASRPMPRRVPQAAQRRVDSRASARRRRETCSALVDRHRHVDRDAPRASCWRSAASRATRCAASPSGSTKSAARRIAAETALDESRERSRRCRDRRGRGAHAAGGRRRGVAPRSRPRAGGGRGRRAARRCPRAITAPARVRDLERELRLMGPINPLGARGVQRAAGRATRSSKSSWKTCATRAAI